MVAIPDSSENGNARGHLVSLESREIDSCEKSSGAETRNAHLFKGVDQSYIERLLRAHDGHTRLHRLRPIHHRGTVG